VKHQSEVRHPTSQCRQESSGLTFVLETHHTVVRVANDDDIAAFRATPPRVTDLMRRTWSGMSTREYKKHKGLKKENLRNNMTNTELMLNMLASPRIHRFLWHENDSEEIRLLPQRANGSLPG
jgi:hypothetical protein